MSTSPTFLDELAFQHRVAHEVNEYYDQLGKTPSEALAELLGISRGVAYKRLHSKAFFTARELAIIQAELDLLVSPLTNQGDPILTFRAPFGDRTGQFSASRYLDLLTNAQDKLGEAYRAGEQPRVLVASSDMPVFYFFSRPVLAAIKLFSFNLEASELSVSPIQLDTYLETHAEQLARTGQLAQSYLDLEAVEIWSRTPLDNMLRQVLHLVSLGLLTESGDIERVFDELISLLNEVHNAIEVGERASGRPFSLLCNEIHYTNSLILLESEVGSTLYVTFDNPYYLISMQPQAVAYFGRHFKYLRTMSDPISRLGQFSAFRFLQAQTDRVEKARQKAQLIVSNRSLEFD